MKRYNIIGLITWGLGMHQDRKITKCCTILNHYRADEEREVEEDYASVLASTKINNRGVTELVDKEL